jgi:hypothetical protein
LWSRDLLGGSQPLYRRYQKGAAVKDPETDRLVIEMEALPTYRGWRFTYEYPGFFCYSHPDHSYAVFFTPDYEEAETLPIEVQDDIGNSYAEHSTQLPLPREGRTGQQLFEMVKPTLDRLMTCASGVCLS